MKISYTSIIDDISAYGKLVYNKSPIVKEHLKKTYYFSVPMLLVLGAFIKYYESNNELLYAWGLLGICWLVYLPFYHQKKYLKKFKDSFEEEKYQILFGTHKLKIENNIIIDSVGLVQAKIEINKIEHIETIENYTFVFIDSAMAFLIPEKSITNGDYNQFINHLKDMR